MEEARQIITPPTVEPVTFEDFAAHHHLYDESESAEVELKIAAARQTIEKLTSLQFITATWRIWLDQFPTGCRRVDREIKLWPGPVQEIESIEWVDQAGETQTMDAEDYQLAKGGQRSARLVAAYGTSWPAARRQPETVAITLLSGFGPTAADVPDWAKQAIRFLASHWYEQRESVNVGNIVTEIPQTLTLMLQSHGVEMFL